MKYLVMTKSPFMTQQVLLTLDLMRIVVLVAPQLIPTEKVTVLRKSDSRIVPQGTRLR